MYSKTTHNVTVSVKPMYLDTESAPDENIYIWAYTVKIENKSKIPLQLRTRYWKITDSYGRTQEVHGPGVVGEEPMLQPGESFEYTSGTPLSTPNGFMAGHYSMQTPEGTLMDIDVPIFSLDTPESMSRLN